MNGIFAKLGMVTETKMIIFYLIIILVDTQKRSIIKQDSNTTVCLGQKLFNTKGKLSNERNAKH